MAHVQHFKKTDVKRVVKEFEREDGYNNSDGRIDTLRTSKNYNLDSKKLSSAGAMDFLEKRLTEVTHSTRKDLNVMSSWVITLPEELKGATEEKKQLFMSTCFNFVKDRYGANNVFGGYVHMDETTPHIHIPFVPVADQQRVSAKALLTKNELHTFHKDLDETMERAFGHKGLILNGRTKGNYTVKELKQRDADEKYIKEQKELNKSYADSLEAWGRALKVQQEAFKGDLRAFELEKAKWNDEIVLELNKAKEMTSKARQILLDVAGHQKDALTSVVEMNKDLTYSQKVAIKPSFDKVKVNRATTESLLRKADEIAGETNDMSSGYHL